MYKRLCALALMATLSLPAAAADQPMAVLFYASWCLNCKLIAPKLAEASQGLEDRIDFITLDVSDDAHRQQAKQRAKDLGFYPLYMKNRATGWVALLRLDGTQVGELRVTMDTPQIRAALEQLAAGALPAAATTTGALQ